MKRSFGRGRRHTVPETAIQPPRCRCVFELSAPVLHHAVLRFATPTGVVLIALAVCARRRRLIMEQLDEQRNLSLRAPNG
jgi:hypothetical protein